ncbi:RidA family protein [Agromyces subbeticus]|uniref:RidA family protein n=1 Tax=Agromyces subbeticus TaxID=293890 RepID=UPI0003B6B820|nr:RidA family protein [Agromyces subbeticus]
MQKQVIVADGVYPPTAEFSQAIRVSGGDLLFVSGIIGMRADGSMPASTVEQVELAFENLARVLVAAGAGLADVVKVNVFVRDDFRLFRDEIREIRARYFTADFPVSTLVQVAGFASPDYRFEIEAIAAVPTGQSPPHCS